MQQSRSNLLNTGRRIDTRFSEKGDIEKLVYSFGDGIIITGLNICCTYTDRLHF